MARLGETQARIDDDGLRVASANEANVELRIVGEHRADPDQNRVVGGPELMGELQRARTAQAQWTTCVTGNAAIEALGIGQRDIGAGPSGRRLLGVRESRVEVR